MSTSERRLPLSFILFLFGCAVTAILTRPSDTPVFSDCTAKNYIPNSPSNFAFNLLFGRLIAASASTSFANITVATAPHSPIYGLYQCRGDLSPSDCSQCVAGAVDRLGTICKGACGGALQMEGCFVKYNEQRFFGVEDKTVVVKKCGNSIGTTDLEALSRLNGALMNLMGSGGSYRTSGAGDLRIVAQCVGDLSVSQCQDCISDAIVRLRSACGSFDWGDLFLAKCYVRFTNAPHDFGYYINDNENSEENVSESSKRLATIMGMITAVVSLLVILFTLFNKIWEKLEVRKVHLCGQFFASGPSILYFLTYQIINWFQ